MVRIKRVSDISTALDLVRRIKKASEPVDVDFSEIDFVSPAAALLISSTLRRIEIKPRISEGAAGFEYASHVGFFDACGIPDVGKKVDEASGSPGYSPIKCIRVEEVERQSRQQGSAVPSLLQTRGENLSRILTRGVNPKIMRVVTYAMREILRNAVEHSKSPALWYAGQYWENAHMVEVAVIDEGVGMLTSLKRNAEFEDVTDEPQAIRTALLPSASGVPEDERTGEWANSGYGLYITKRICMLGAGAFAVVSNDAAIAFTNTDEKEQSSLFQGALVQMRVDTSQLDELNGDFAERIAEEGEAEAEQRTGKKRPASASAKSVVIEG